MSSSTSTDSGHHFKEQALLLPRLLRQPKPELPLSLPAAAGLLGLVTAVAAFGSRFKLGPRTICFAGNDTGAPEPDRARRQALAGGDARRVLRDLVSLDEARVSRRSRHFADGQRYFFGHPIPE